MTSTAMVRIIAIVFLSMLTTFSDSRGQERFKDLDEEHERRQLEFLGPQPDYPQGAQVAAHEGDSLTLVAFFDSTGGPSTWINRAGWLQEPVHQWHGITLDASGRVISILLNGNRLIGSLPTALGQLANLEWLQLQRGKVDNKWIYNEFSSGIIPELSRLENLQALSLAGSQLEGGIPVELAQLSSLETLDLSTNSLTGGIPPELAQLGGLRTLRLFSNDLSGPIPPELGHLTELTLLSLYDNDITGSIPPELGQLTKLVALYLDYNDLSGPIPPDLGQLVNLLALRLSGNNLSGAIPPELGQISDLIHLYLWGNDLSGPIPPELGRLSQLEELSLDRNNLTGPIPSDLGQLARLMRLSLHYNNLSGQLPPQLGQLGLLRDLWLMDNNLTGHIPPELGDLAMLKLLTLNENNLSGPIPAELGQLTELETLWLRNNDFSGPIPSEFGQLSKLESLWLSGNDLSGPIPPQLGQLSELWELDLYSNNMSGAIPPELSNMQELRDLDLRKNSFSGPIPPELGDLSKLQTLFLSSNTLSGPIPPQLGQLRELRELDLSSNKMTGAIPPELGNLQGLAYLDIRWNSLSSPIPADLGNLTNLETLYLSNNDLSGQIPSQLGQLGELWELDLSANKITGTIPPELGQLEYLFEINLHDNKLFGPIPDWTRLDELEAVHLQVNQFLFSDLLLNAELSRIPKFTYAPQDTIDTQLTCSASEYVFTTPATAQGNRYQWYRNEESLPGAQSDTLRIAASTDPDDYHAKITNNRLPELTLVSRKVSTGGASGCTAQQHAHVADSTLLVDFYNRTHGSLLWHNHTGWLEDPVAQWYGITLDASGRVTDVNLPYNNLVGQLPLSQLDQLAHLRYLNVSGNEFSGTIPEEFGALTQLEYLVLGHNKLAGTIPRELADQAPLKVLDISGNQLAGEIPTELNQITTLQTFSVSANQLSGPVPDFTGLDQLDSLHVAQNEFLFMDLLPNASLTRLDDFVYAPQDSIDTFLSRTASGFAFTTAAKAMGNRYQWYRDDRPISGPQSDTLRVSASSDPAQYHATITNDRLPELTLVSRKKGVHDGVTMTEAELPQDFLLHQSYPNPFAEATTVAFELATPEHVRIVVYDLLGKAVATIADGRFTAGVHRVEFTGDYLASGQYLYRMEAGTYQATRFMSVVR